MNIAKHEFLPEEVMAFLDGELSPDRCAKLAAHIESCPDCSTVAENVRGVSQSLGAWKVEAAPARVSSPAIQAPAAANSSWQIAFSAHRYRGLKLAIGIVAAILLLFAIATPNLLRSRMAANEAVAVGSLRTINTSAARYFNSYGHYPPSLKNLGPSPSDVGSEDRAGLIDGMLAQGLKSGYLFSYHAASNASGYRVAALPIDSSKSGVRRFFTDQSGLIRAEPGGVLGGSGAEMAQLHEQAVTKSVPLSDSETVVDGNLNLESKAKARHEFASDGYKGWLANGPMIARTASLSIIVKDFAASRSLLDAILTRYQGYAASLTVSSPQESAHSLQASLRIPAPQLAAAVAELKSLGSVEGESQNGEEITQQHSDLVARLKNSAETEQRLQAILTERTGKIGDVLSVEQEIARVRGEIEQMEAEQKNLEHRVDFATIDLKLSEEYKAKLDSPAPAISTLIHNAAVNGYRNVADTLLSIVLFFAEFGPVLTFWLLVLAVPATLLWRRWRQATAAI
jgi:type II secretory pathway pseudopilin PulG